MREWLLGFAFKFVDGAQVRRLLRVAAEIERRWLRNMPYLQIWPDAEEDVLTSKSLCACAKPHSSNTSGMAHGRMSTATTQSAQL